MEDLKFSCVFEWRYGSQDMRELFTSESMIKRFLQVEVALLAGLEEAGLADRGCSENIAKCVESITAKEVYELETVTGHDIASLAQIAGERCGPCGRFFHLGATSYDIVDTAWTLIFRDALSIVKKRLIEIIDVLSDLALREADTIMVGRTHGQHALPITLGFKLANYVYELSRSLERIADVEKRVIKCKISGAVGTMAAWRDKGLVVEKTTCSKLGLEPHTISTQVAPRDGFAELVSALAILASQLDRFALEIRELSRTEIGELAEGGERVGSSTMPQKRNPVTAERVSGLAKIARSLSIAAFENIPLMHERDLTNSSSERVLLPHLFLIIDQMLLDTKKLLKTLVIDREAMAKNLELTKGAIMAESVMMKLVEKGVPRHKAHAMVMEVVRKKKADESFAEALSKDSRISSLLTHEEIREALDYRSYLGSYKQLIFRALEYAKKVKESSVARPSES
ncbi:MAG: adenylosuccinate lyase [Acidilobaceae archaeon]